MLTCTDDPAPEITALPFVKDDPAWEVPGERGPQCFWAVEIPDDDSQDWERGAEYAKAALQYMNETRFTPLLGHITNDMILKAPDFDRPEGRIVIGFMQEIARYALYGWRIAQQARALPNGWSMVVSAKPVEPDENQPAVTGGIAKPVPLPAVEIGRSRSGRLPGSDSDIPASGVLLMPIPSFERRAEKIADSFLDLEVDSDAEAKAWLVEMISAALEHAEEAGYKRAMAKPF
jgi:hypothetical protein